MSGLEQFAPDLSTTDTKKKLTVGVNIVNYLKDETNPLDCEDIGGFIDGLVPWMQSSNFKVCFRENSINCRDLLMDNVCCRCLRMVWILWDSSLTG